MCMIWNIVMGLTLLIPASYAVFILDRSGWLLVGAFILIGFMWAKPDTEEK